MTKYDAAFSSKLTARAASLFVCCLLSLLLSAAASAQTASAWSATDGTTPPSHAPGAPAGSYALSGFENVNLYNGNLHFALPLLKLGGRGLAAHTITLPLEIHWRETHVVTPTGCNQSGCSGTEENIYPTPNGWQTRISYAPGTMSIRQAKEGEVVHRNEHGLEVCRYYQTTLARLTFTNADGTEFELRDALHAGRPLPHQHCNDGSTYSRGRVFVSADGSAATFFAAADIHDVGPYNLSGELMLRDGTRYGIGGGGAVLWVRDRNGNKVSFAYDSSNRVSSITDAIGRQFTISYADPTRPYDEIAFAGFGGVPRTIRVHYGSLSSALMPGLQPQTYQALFPGLDGSSTSTFNPANTATAVVLPDGRQYTFKYNAYGELSRVDLPTGGRYEYDYVSAAGGPLTQGVNHRVRERRVYRDAGQTMENRTQYTASYVSSSPYPYTTVVTAETFDAGSVSRSLTKHYFHGWPGSDEVLNNRPTSYSAWINGREYKTETLDPANQSVVLRRAEQEWQQRAPVSWWNSSNGPGPANDPRVVETKTTIEPAGPNLVTKQTSVDPATGAVGFDQYNNPTDVWEYDFGTGTPGALLRRTHTDYVTGSTYTDHTGAHLRSLSSGQQVYGVIGGVETLVAKSEALYDQYGLTGYASVAGWEDPQRAARGNATTRRRWLDTSNTWLETRAAYDQVGNVVTATDARNNTSAFSYSDVFSDGGSRNTYAFPTQNTTTVPAPPSPHPAAGRGSNTPFTISSVYDYSTGLVKSATDANGKVTSFEYNDPLDRLKRTDRPDGGRTTYTYVDQHQCGPYVEARTLLDDSGRETDDYQFFDGLGRGVRTFKYDPQDASNPYQTADTQYDAMGRVRRVSNPYRSAGCLSAVNPSGRWMTTEYDALGRVKTVTTPDGAAVKTDYDGPRVLVTDQNNRQRISRSDSLGRLREVWEIRSADPASGTEAVSFPSRPDVPAVAAGYRTAYDYDALGNLRRVTQGAQTRHFMYDSIGRLVRAKLPEQAAFTADADFPALTDTSLGQQGNSAWSVGYVYDENGNILKRKDARDVTTTYQYDNLNRPIRTDYSDGTPFTLYTYDFATNGRGRFHANYESSTSGTINYVFAYDAMGRPTSGRMDFYYLPIANWVQGYAYARAYDKAGNVTSQTYPSGHTVSYNYDAAGRLSDHGGNAAFSGNLGDGAARTYSAGLNYDEAGRMRQERFGTASPLYHKRHHNVRGQLYDVRLSTVAWQPDGTGEWDWNRGALQLFYGGAAYGQSGPSNNGTVTKAEHWVPANDQVSTYNYTRQTYAYDALNRLASVTEQAGTPTSLGGAHAAQHYDYDRWGNRTINATATFGTDIPEPQYELSPPPSTQEVPEPSNRLYAPGDAGRTPAQKHMRYDKAGNLVHDEIGGGRTYDAENRMTSAWGPGLYGGSYQNVYVYDAAGKRVRRRMESGEVWQVYGFDGDLLAEYAVAGAPSQPRKEYGYREGELLVVAEAAAQGAAAPPGTNLAAGKPAAQTSTVVGGVASRAVDGNTDGNWHANSVTHTDGHNQAWWQVDLGASYPVQDIKVWNRTDCCGDRLSNFYVLVSDSPFNSYDLTATINQAGVSAYYTAAQGGSPTTVAANRTGRYVRVQLAGANALSLAEVQVLAGGGGSAPAAGLAGYWKFDEGAGATAADSSGNSLTGTLSGASWATGQPGAAASFDGADDYVGMGAPAALAAGSAFSLSAWVYPTGPGSLATYGGIIVNKEGEYELARFTDGTIQWAVANSNPGWNWVNTGAVAPLNQWTHVAFVYDGATAKTYVNGSLAHTQSVAGAVGDVDGSQNEFRVGGRQCCSQHFAGRIDEVRFYNRALTGGEAAQTSGAGGAAGTSQVRWLVSDHLGTPRMTVDQTGSLAGVRRHDYLPFGEEIGKEAGGGVGGRTTGQGYSADSIRQKFTGYERDVETGLSYAQARYYANAQGRFTGVDPLMASAKPALPQSWNRYAYCLNNPTVYVDPTGLIWGERSLGNGRTEIRWFNDQAELDAAGSEWKATTNFLRRNTSGGWYSFNRFAPTYETMSDYAVAGGLFTGETGYRMAGGTSPVFMLTNTLPNAVDAIERSQAMESLRRDRGVQGALFALSMMDFPGARFGGAAGVRASATGEMVTVGRWMSKAEFEAMSKAKMVQESRNLGMTNVAYPANASSFLRQASVGDFYVEFSVPLSSLRPKGGDWWVIPGPHSIYARQALKQGQPAPQMPPAGNITHCATKICN